MTAQVKALIRDALARSLSVLNIFNSTLSGNNRWLILTFHRVLPASLREAYPLPNLAVTPEELAWIIDTVKPLFDIKTVDEAYKCWVSTSDFAPMLSITFDDGQWDNLEYAAPVLDSKAVKATFYLPTDFMETDRLLWHDQAAFAWKTLVSNQDAQESVKSNIGIEAFNLLDMSSAPLFVKSLKQVNAQQRAEVIDSLVDKNSDELGWARMMSWEEARQLHGSGHEIGSHGRSHNLLPQQNNHQQLDELIGSRRTIEEKLSISPDSFCYPNGDYDQNTLNLLQQSGYRNAVTTLWGTNERFQGHPAPDYELLRCDMNPFLMVDRKGHLSRDRLLMRLAGFVRGNGR